MVFLGLRVAHSLVKTLLKCLRVWTLDTNPLIVFLEVIDLHNLLQLLLESIFSCHGEASKVVVDSRIKPRPVKGTLRTRERLSHDLSECEEHHSDLEARQASLKANLLTCFFHRHLLVLILVISVIELRHNSEDPEGLSIELFLKITTLLEKIQHAKLITDHRNGKDVAE